MARKVRGGPDRHIELKGLTYWFRREIPAPCRSVEAAEGRKGRFYRESLATGDLRAARARRDTLERETDGRWSDMKAGRYVPPTAPSAAESGSRWRQALVDASAQDKAGGGGPRDDDMTSVVMEAAEAAAGRLKGPARDAFVAAFKGAVAVDHHLEDFLGASAVAPKTKNSRRGLVKQLAAWAAGQGLTLDAIEREQAGRYYREKLVPRDKGTRRNHLQALRRYWSFLHAQGLYKGGDKDGAPWTGLEEEKRGGRAERRDRDKERPFTVEELTALLYGPWPAGMDTAFRPQIEDALRVSLLSGMRLGDVLSLWVEDAKDGAFDIKEGKTEDAARRFPIHSGLVELVARRTNGKGPKELLFHELAGERDPKDTFGKRFARYREALRVDDKREGKRRSLVNFHSARRFFVTTASHAGHPDRIIKDVIGHKAGKGEESVFRAYIPDGAAWEQRRAVVESVTLPPPSRADAAGDAEAA